MGNAKEDSGQCFVIASLPHGGEKRGPLLIVDLDPRGGVGNNCHSYPKTRLHVGGFNTAG